MKRATFIILTVCFHSASFAQNWAPINTTDKFNYIADTASVISNTLWVDSVQLQGSDSVYFMNRIVTVLYGDTVPLTTYLYALKNQPQFLQETVTTKPGGLYVFSQPGNLAYYSQDALNSSWLFDSINSITATIIKIDSGTVLGSPDSLKTILLSSGDTIIASKSFGFTFFPVTYGSGKYYRLAGIESGRVIGEHVARFADFFNFQIGDKFEYADFAYGPDSYTKIDSAQIEIMGKNVFLDSMVYAYRKYSHTIITYINFTNIIDTVLGTISMTSSPSLVSNLYPKTIVPSFQYQLDPTFAASNFYPVAVPISCVWISAIPVNKFYTGFASYKGQNGHILKICNDFYGEDSLVNRGDTIYYLGKDQRVGDVGMNYEIFQTTLGCTSYSVDYCFEGRSGGALIAWKTSTDSSGTLHNFTLGINDIGSIEFSVKLLNNPIVQTLNLKLSEVTVSTVRIIDLSGRELLTQQEKDQHIAINMNSFAAGMYIVEVAINNSVWRQKVVKM